VTAPLEGVLVVSVEQAIAAPFASRQLADLGARVLKIERPGSGDFARDYDTAVAGTAFGQVTESALRHASSTIAHHDASAIVPSIPNPCLVVCGEHDEETPLSYSEALAEALPRGELAVIRGAGHLSSIEHPESFNEIVRNFLA